MGGVAAMALAAIVIPVATAHYTKLQGSQRAEKLEDMALWTIFYTSAPHLPGQSARLTHQIYTRTLTP